MSVRDIPVGYQARFGTKYSVKFPDFPSFTAVPYEIEIHQKRKHHDVFILKYQMLTTFFFKGLKTGTTVQLNWKTSSPATGKLVGYVTSVKKTKASQFNQEIEITCVAGSFPLKNTAANVWVSKTVPEVVQDIAKKTKMKAVVSSHSTRYGQLAQHGLSYWEYLVELSHTVGYGLWIDGTTIYMRSVDDILKNPMGTMPKLFFENQYAPPFHAPIERTLDRFEPIASDYAEGMGPLRRDKSIAGVDPITGKVYNASSSPKSAKSLRVNQAQVLFQEQGSTMVVNNQQAATNLAKAKSEDARLTTFAHWSGQGDPRLKPYNLTEVEGIDDTHDGVWVVASCKHTISKTGSYVCSGTLMADGNGPAKSVNSRQTSAGTVPVLNLQGLDDGGSLLPSFPTLSPPTSMFNETESGYTLNSRRWVG